MTQTTTEIKSLIVRESKDLTIAQKFARRGLLKAFSGVQFGRLTIADGEHTFSFEGDEAGPEASINVLDPQVWSDQFFFRVILRKCCFNNFLITFFNPN